MKPQWLNRALINAPYYTLCLTEPDFRREVKRLGVTDPVPFVRTEQAHASTHFMTDKDSALCAIVTMRDWETRNGIEIAGLLVHEAVHIWQEWCSHYGESNPGSETEAYSIQWLSQQLMWEFTRQVKP